ncbi:DnaJ domain-containing protein [Legionella worsleiensis]|uniref:Curved DNA binding protein DnaJ n=1 Tax=Legionella worsleiensis TaxID=45076 RepID=A0A0W1ALP7_9GAMM|nr:DnaJ domain-containing protein [Legionella worsleiensis]KTD82083.1 curved DNA binding protein DnaJ [Legionella worsleiensis]STY31499.1 curved DNA binding protein DnaJ [Legionella worsleiensis]
MSDYYKILGISRNVTTREIKTAYRQKAVSLHPDKGGDEQQFKQLAEAYAVLSDPIKRQHYDMTYEVLQDVDCAQSSSIRDDGLLMPGKMKPYSFTYRQEHLALVNQYKSAPVFFNTPYLHREHFKSELYVLRYGEREERYHDIYSFINRKQQLWQCLSLPSLEALQLSARNALKILRNFLNGDYFGETLSHLIHCFGNSLRSNKSSPEALLYEAVYEILVMSERSESAHYLLINALIKITDYAKNSDDESLKFIAPLFYNKQFRNLYAYALHLDWDNRNDLFNPQYLSLFDGIEPIQNQIHQLQAHLYSSQNNHDVIKVIRYLKLLYSFDKEMKRELFFASSAEQLREKAFRLLDWLPFLMETSSEELLINTLLQIGLSFQRAGLQEPNPIIQMADETTALKIYTQAMSLAHHATPFTELYANTKIIKFISAFGFEIPKANEIMLAFKKSCLTVADVFPFLDIQQSNFDFFEQKNKTRALMRRYLNLLMAVYEYNKNHEDTIVVPHANSTILYHAYEACLKNWYQEQHDPDLEQKIRLDLMDELLFAKGWTFFDVEQRVSSEWIMANRDASGWLNPSRSLPFPESPQLMTYRRINGVEVNKKTGELSFFMAPWSPDYPPSEQLFTFFDLEQLLRKKITHGIFSLDPIDSDKPYHPFNLMRFAPGKLGNSELLNTMLMTDYLLKFLTTNQEVQGQYPFEQRSVDQMIEHLPDYLKKIIYDYHKKQHSGALHRFWIEAEEQQIVTDEQSDADSIRIEVGSLKMVLKKHRMERDIHGELKDVGNEDEGWPVYVLTQSEYSDLLSGRRVISGHAMIFIYPETKVMYWEYNEIVHGHLIAGCNEKLIRLYRQPKNSAGQIVPKTQNMHLLYQLTNELSRQTGISTRYSPEFVFAHEFTVHYDEFAQYFPEFGRLRELCKITSLVNFLSGMHNKNTMELSAIRGLLNRDASSSAATEPSVDPLINLYYKNAFEQMRQNIINQFDALVTELATSVLNKKWSEQLTNITRQIGSLEISPYSKEVNELCRQYSQQLAKDNPGAPSSLIHAEVERQRNDLARTMSQRKQSSIKQELKTLFSASLSGVSSSQLEHVIHLFMRGTPQPLRDLLVATERSKVLAVIKPRFAHCSATLVAKALDDYGRDAAAEIGLFEARRQLNEIMLIKERLKSGFEEIHLGEEESSDDDLDEQCYWVPASVRHDVDKRSNRYSFFVYGGVSLLPQTRVTSGITALSGSMISGQSFRHIITQGFQSHHIISPTNHATKDHELLSLAGFNNKRDINSQVNRIYLPDGKRSFHPTRSVHSGRHTQFAMDDIGKRMDVVVEKGKSNNWSQSQYRTSLRELISEMRQELRGGRMDLYAKMKPSSF